MPESSGREKCVRKIVSQAFFAAFLAATFIATSHADVLHLKSGGQIEGTITERTEQYYKVRTLVGTVTVPLDTVLKIDETPSILDEYESRRAAVENTAAAHVALAQWCEQQELASAYRSHMRLALKLDPDCRRAREALGYMRADGKWITKRRLEQQSSEVRPENDAAPPPAPTLSPEEEEALKIIDAVRSQWTIQIRAILSHKLDSDVPRLIEDGRQRILKIDDPLAIEPMSRLLSAGGLPARQALVEALSLFPQDEATANLAMLAIIDADPNIRRAALLELKNRNDPRVIPQFRRALLSNNDELIKRASAGLGTLQATAAIPDLIDLLTAQRQRLVELTTRVYFQEFQMRFLNPTTIQLSTNHRLRYTPNIGVNYNDVGFDNCSINREYEVRNVTVYRTEVLEALKKITGVNHGFDAKAWLRWFEEQ